MVKCFHIDSNPYNNTHRYLMLEDGVLAPNNIRVKQGEVREFNEKSFEFYKPNLQIESLDNYGKVVFHKIISSLLGVVDEDIIKDGVIVRKDNTCMILEGYIEKFENADIFCRMELDLPSFKINDLGFEDMDSSGREHRFKVNELCGLSVLTQRKEILEKVNAIRKSYKKDVKLITEHDNLLVKLVSHMPTISAPQHDDSLKDVAKYRHDNNLYMGPIGFRRAVKALDESILNDK